ncbi:hypothetical protein Taro_005999 [Colocasia esculenta]|uniref:Uncharacterized protein n=1 Tax=Colocasia esculenta TaxID=4460 RepID=A0A843TRC5_COLES|nr:hypothetical protein [Colocasia esculenta]
MEGRRRWRCGFGVWISAPWKEPKPALIPKLMRDRVGDSGRKRRIEGGGDAVGKTVAVKPSRLGFAPNPSRHVAMDNFDDFVNDLLPAVGALLIESDSDERSINSFKRRKPDDGQRAANVKAFLLVFGHLELLGTAGGFKQEESHWLDSAVKQNKKMQANGSGIDGSMSSGACQPVSQTEVKIRAVRKRKFYAQRMDNERQFSFELISSLQVLRDEVEIRYGKP